ncbi:hypothetical protein CDG79_24305 [Nostoc sp. 'Peltigera membranacea cyanobiont' 232]|nr:hypothetical protein CDG79_24305 [Nostoc sp. 'Peltigera membranacea cyanobiont' 232]
MKSIFSYLQLLMKIKYYSVFFCNISTHAQDTSLKLNRKVPQESVQPRKVVEDVIEQNSGVRRPDFSPHLEWRSNE